VAIVAQPIPAGRLCFSFAASTSVLWSPAPSSDAHQQKAEGAAPLAARLGQAAVEGIDERITDDRIGGDEMETREGEGSRGYMLSGLWWRRGAICLGVFRLC
jgi:hypothetical protein